MKYFVKGTWLDPIVYHYEYEENYMEFTTSEFNKLLKQSQDHNFSEFLRLDKIDDDAMYFSYEAY